MRHSHGARVFDHGNRWFLVPLEHTKECDLEAKDQSREDEIPPLKEKKIGKALTAEWTGMP